MTVDISSDRLSTTIKITSQNHSFLTAITGGIMSLDDYHRDTWAECLQAVKAANIYEPYIFSAMFDDSELISMRDNTLTIKVPRFVSKTMIKDQKEQLEKIFSQVLNGSYSLEVLDARDAQSLQNTSSGTQQPFDDHILPQFTFDNFVVGNSNKPAQSAAVACAYNPGNFYNPLFIYGDSGLGKTHLLFAIGNYIKKNRPMLRVLYLTTDELINRYVNASGKRSDESIQEFSDLLKSVDVLLIDDIQFLAGKSKTNDFFFNIYNILVNDRKQIVMTSDKSPYELNNVDIEERLVSRFASGLTVSITTPEFVTRKKILEMKLKERKMDNDSISDETLTYIAANCVGDVRKLEGVLNQLIFNQIQFPDMDSKTILRDILKINMDDEKRDPAKIIRTVGDYYHLTRNQLLSKSRSKNIVTARHMAMYICRKDLDMPYSKIGQQFNGCDHTTVMSAISKVQKKIDTDPFYQQAYKDIEERLE